MSISVKPFGATSTGKAAALYTMTNKSGASVSVTDYGAITVSILVPDREDKLADVCLGFEDVSSYEADHACMGDTIGRCGNRIGKGKFTLDGVDYQLELNNGRNHLHGGFTGFASFLWEASAHEGVGKDSVSFHRVSPDGEGFYPGNLDVTVTYSWDDECNLSIRYQATTDKATLCNLTNHTYFNLAGHDHGTIKDHELFIDSDVITPTDAELIPDGSYLPVCQTPFDMREGLLLGDGLAQTESVPAMKLACGYDHNYVLRKGFAMGLAAVLYHGESGRTMEVITDQPAVQLYTASTTDLPGGKGGTYYGQHCSLCLETQLCPDSINNPQFPGSVVLRPGEKYDTTTIYAFRVDA